jgi:hypothetical protein
MIQTVAPATAFSIGFQYYSERRVRIIESDDLKISSEVGGFSGQYQQTIRLANGSLLAKCSCPSNERPLCRHCVAALLENYHLASDIGHSSSDSERQPGAVTQEKVACEGPISAPDTKASALGLSLREITFFIDWVQLAVQALKSGQALPVARNLGSVEALDWMATLQQIEAESRRNKEQMEALEFQLRAKEGQLAAMAVDLEAALEKTNAVKTTCDALRLDSDRQRERLRQLVGIEQERNRLAVSLRTLTGEMLKKAEWIEQLTVDLNKSSDKNSDGQGA